MAQMADIKKLNLFAIFIILSYVLLLLFVWDYATSYQEFFLIVVSLERSALFWMLLANAIIASMLLLWFFLETIFFGPMTITENTVIYNAFAVDLIECVLMPLYVDYSIMNLYTVVSLFTLVLRLLHRLAKERVTNIGIISDRLTKLIHFVRLQLFIIFAASIDIFVMAHFVNLAYMQTPQKLLLYYTILTQYWQMFLVTLRVSILLFLGFHKSERTPLVFYTESILNLLEWLSSIVSFSFIWIHTELPFVQVRIFISSVLNTIKTIGEITRFYKMQSRIKKFPSITARDLEWDGRCTICYEDMSVDAGARRLPCGHCYHEKCLTQWFEQHSTCPYCRANLLHFPVSPTEQTLVPERPVTSLEAEAPITTESAAPLEVPEYFEALLDNYFDKTMAEINELETETLGAMDRSYRMLANYKVLLEDENLLESIADSVEMSSVPNAQCTTGSEKQATNFKSCLGNQVLRGQELVSATTTKETEHMKDTHDDSVTDVGATTLYTSSLRHALMRMKALKRYQKRLEEAEKELVDSLESIDKLGTALD